MFLRRFIIILVALLVASIAIWLLYLKFGLPGYLDDTRLRNHETNIMMLVDAIDKWGKDNNDIYPMDLYQLNKKKHTIEYYLLKPIKQNYPEGSENVNNYIIFIHNPIPKEFKEYGKPGTIYVFSSLSSYTVVGFGYKNQKILRSDNDDFKLLYSTYIPYYRKIYSK